MKLLEFLLDVFATMILLMLIFILGFFERLDERKRYRARNRQ